jgi:hypothetical protein
MPELVQLREQYGDRGFEILAITKSDTLGAVEAADEKEGWNINFRVVVDKSGEITSTYGISSFPTYYLIDADGTVVAGAPPATSQLEELVANARVYKLPEDLPKSLARVERAFEARAYGAVWKQARKVADRGKDDAEKATELVALIDQIAEDSVAGIHKAVDEQDFVKAVKRCQDMIERFDRSDHEKTAKALEEELSEEHEDYWKAATLFLGLEQKLARAKNDRAREKLIPLYRQLAAMVPGTPLATRALAKARKLEPH